MDLMLAMLVVFEDPESRDQHGNHFCNKGSTFMKLITGFMDNVVSICVDGFVDKIRQKCIEKGNQFKNFPYVL